MGIDGTGIECDVRIYIRLKLQVVKILIDSPKRKMHEPVLVPIKVIIIKLRKHFVQVHNFYIYQLISCDNELRNVY